MGRPSVKRSPNQKRHKQTRRRTNGGKVFGVDFSKIKSIGFEFETSEASFIMFDGREYFFEPKTNTNERTYTVNGLNANIDMYLQPDYGITDIHTAIRPVAEVYAEQLFDEILEKENVNTIEDYLGVIDTITDEINHTLFIVNPKSDSDQEGGLNMDIKIEHEKGKLNVNPNIPNCEYVITFFRPMANSNQIMVSLSKAIEMLCTHFDTMELSFNATVEHAMFEKPEAVLPFSLTERESESCCFYRIPDGNVEYNIIENAKYIFTPSNKPLKELHFTPQVTIGVSPEHAIDVVKSILDNRPAQLKIFEKAVEICERVKKMLSATEKRTIDSKNMVFMVFALYIGMNIPQYVEYKANPTRGTLYFKDFTAINFRHKLKPSVMDRADISIFKDEPVVSTLFDVLMAEKEYITSTFVMFLADRLTSIYADEDTLHKYVPVFTEINSYKTAFEYNDAIIFEYRALYADIIELDGKAVSTNKEMPVMPLIEMQQLAKRLAAEPAKKKTSIIDAFKAKSAAKK